MRKQTGETLLVKKSGGKFYIPDEGDVIWINFDDPPVGHEQSGHRRAVVISAMAYNSKGLAIVCPITRTVKNYSFEVPVPKNLNLTTVGVILADHIKSVDWKERKANFIEKVNQETLYEIQQRLNCLILPSIIQ
jgi:mRNA interferase MazF